MEDHLARVPEHLVRVVPEGEEAQHVTVVVEELFQSVVTFVWTQRLRHLRQLCTHRRTIINYHSGCAPRFLAYHGYYDC